MTQVTVSSISPKVMIHDSERSPYFFGHRSIVLISVTGALKTSNIKIVLFILRIIDIEEGRQ
jgi:hypothetical protein